MPDLQASEGRIKYKTIDFTIVGPFTNEAKKTTGNKNKTAQSTLIRFLVTHTYYLIHSYYLIHRQQ